MEQSGALSLVGIVEIVLSLVESFIEQKYFHDVAPPALLCHKEPARRIQRLWNAKYPNWGNIMISDLISDHECSTLPVTSPIMYLGDVV